MVPAISSIAVFREGMGFQIWTAGRPHAIEIQASGAIENQSNQGSCHEWISMNECLFQKNDRLKQEADTLLYDKGLLEVLSIYGKPHVHGSYALDLMTWRDLDIYLEVAILSEPAFRCLAVDLRRILSPVKMCYRSEYKAKSFEQPQGLYWGIYLGSERQDAWKIDLWAVEDHECNRLLRYSQRLRQRISEESRQRIMNIKSQCCKDPLFRNAYSSADIYEAVLDQNVLDVHDFRQYLRTAL
jgi:hypothetical protein